MTRKRRVYIIHRSSELPEQEILSNMDKIKENANVELTKEGLITRLHRAKLRTGKQLIRLKDKEGNPIIIEVRDVE